MIDYFETQEAYKKDLAKALKSNDFSALEVLDFSTLNDALEIEMVKEFYIHYQRLGGTDDLVVYTNKVSDFLEITLSAVCGGDLEKPDGSYWQSSEESIKFWADKHNLTSDDRSLYFKSIDDVAPYT